MCICTYISLYVQIRFVDVGTLLQRITPLTGLQASNTSLEAFRVYHERVEQTNYGLPQ